ncbi:MAG TPA: LysR substrate-binding domain-containing protein [Afifellaceae bacterium]|nr:LysR substrate-binding domain-containing protein [Afifellaceae bacterium]
MAMQPIIDPELLRTFLAIADTGSFSAAADIVGRTPSAVSMQIKKLEEMIDRRLFDRDSRSVVLTAHGEALVVDARRIVELNIELVARMRTPDLAGSITVGTPDEYAGTFLPCVLRRFARTHPAVQVNVVCDYSTNLQDKLQHGEIDAAMITEGEMKGDATSHRIVYEEDLVWLGARDGMAWKHNPLPVAVANEKCKWRVRSVGALSRAGIAHKVAYASASAAGQLAAVAADLAVAPLPVSLETPSVVRLGPETGLPDLGTYRIAFIWQDRANACVSALADHVVASFDTGTSRPVEVAA